MMKKLINSKSHWVLAILLLALISSCEKEGLKTISLADEVALSLSAYATIPSSEAAVVLYNKQKVFDKIQSKGFPAVLSSDTGSPVEVTANVDYNPRLLQLYDSLFHTKSPALTDGMFAISGTGKVTVGAGSAQSTDSIHVNVTDLSKFAIGTYNFVVPVTMTSGSNLLKSKVMYIRYKVVVSSLTLQGMGVSNTGGVKFYNMNLPSGYPIPLGPYVQVLLDKATPYVSTYNFETISSPELAAAYSASSGVRYLPFPPGSFVLSPTISEIGANAIVPTVAKSLRILCYGTYFTPGRYLMAVRLKTPTPTVLPVAELIKSPDVIYLAVFVF